MKFEDYLKDVHARNYMGTDDDMSDDYDNWLAGFDDQDWFKHADYWMEHELKDVTAIRVAE